MNKLKPCPFCGGINITIEGHTGQFWVLCECGAEGPTPSTLWKTEKEAIKAWNRREGEQDVRESKD